MIVRFNQTMSNVLATGSVGWLGKELQGVLDGGRILFHDECYLFDFLKDWCHASLTDFPDETGYECFVNKMHLSDFGEPNSILSAFGVIPKVNFMFLTAGYLDLKLRHIISRDLDFVYRFHVVRPGQVWHDEDLDRCIDPVFVADCVVNDAWRVDLGQGTPDGENGDSSGQNGT